MIKKNILLILFSLLIPAFSLCMDPLWFTKKKTNWVLLKQRYDMKKRLLLENEKKAAQALLESFYFSPNETKTILAQAEKKHQHNLACLKNNYLESWFEKFQKTPLENLFNLEDPVTISSYFDISTDSIDPNLPKEWVNAIQFECNRHNIDINKLKLTIMEPTYKAFASTCFDDQIHIVNLNKHEATEDPTFIPIAAAHEMTHLTQGHSIKTACIVSAIQKKQPFFRSIESIEKTNAYQAYKRAKEKTADTLVACTDPVYTKAYNRNKSGYKENHTDMKRLEQIWDLEEKFEKGHHD